VRRVERPARNALGPVAARLMPAVADLARFIKDFIEAR